MSDNPMSNALNKLTDAIASGDPDLKGKMTSDAIDGVLKIFEGRKWCLELAVGCASEGSTPQGVVDAARMFESYLDGKQ